jgi:hypothetical protein
VDSDDSIDYYHETEAFDGENRRLHSPKEAKPEIESDLVRYRFRMPILKPGEERDLLRLAQAGNGRAQNELVRRFHRKVLKIAGEYHGAGFEDLVAAGILGLARAIKDFDLRRNNGLGCFAEERIREEIRREVKRWRKRGQAGETRADRWLYHHRGATAEEVSAATACTLADAEQAIQRQEGYWHGHREYDTNEVGRDDSDEGERKRFVYVATARATPIHYKHLLISKTVHAAADYADHRAEARLREIGRRAYAIELVDRKPYPPRDRYPGDVVSSRIKRVDFGSGRWKPGTAVLTKLEFKIMEKPDGRAAYANVRNDLSQHPVGGADRRAKRARH